MLRLGAAFLPVQLFSSLRKTRLLQQCLEAGIVAQRIQLLIDLEISDKVAVGIVNVFQRGKGFLFFAQLDVRSC
jgi:hypothetical protein